MKLICTQNFFMMDSIELAFKEGNVYDVMHSSKIDPYVIEADERGEEHYMDDEAMNQCFCMLHWMNTPRSKS